MEREKVDGPTAGEEVGVPHSSVCRRLISVAEMNGSISRGADRPPTHRGQLPGRGRLSEEPVWRSRREEIRRERCLLIGLSCLLLKSSFRRNQWTEEVEARRRDVGCLPSTTQILSSSLTREPGGCGRICGGFRVFPVGKKTASFCWVYGYFSILYQSS
ncbi:hypothetical protein TNIN_104361 [Trichonephila inaurata madagascariensis]|uniref:Uncharacterized protein n=1 Tax=Trichonephila inaurata madagascariensis TaxID=2747483 RepID=A0A8X6YHT4_9ARAC|nr:hypothetical protein TNIN_104361 [Trichonephila inaurata madagascariensis]